MAEILSIVSSCNEPAYNLAAEEYLLRSKVGDYHFYYINRPSVIIGKHQNALSEINLNYLQANKISLFRRLSGGGTVYHDFGNINFCFIKNGKAGDLVNFKKATAPIVEVLNQWGLNVKHGERNDLLLNYKKISGNACHVFKQRVMHHGTILYDSDITALTACLRNDPTRFRDKAVKSVKSEVINIKGPLKSDKSADEFLKDLVDSINKNYSAIIPYQFSPEEEAQIIEIQKTKFDTPEWNYRYGPPYIFKKRSVLSGFTILVEMKIEKGKIVELSIKDNYPDKSIFEQIRALLTGLAHERDEIERSLKAIEAKLEISAAELSTLFF
ncbi:MAG: lipoate--protein ligase [Bacteroidales bacterium]|nr:lipoate--protein ligase [Bacteroidales bacterium]